MSWKRDDTEISPLTGMFCNKLYVVAIIMKQQYCLKLWLVLYKLLVIMFSNWE